MFLREIAERGNVPVLEKTLAYIEARQQLIADGIANIDNPEYKGQYLHPALFQQALWVGRFREGLTREGAS